MTSSQKSKLKTALKVSLVESYKVLKCLVANGKPAKLPVPNVTQPKPSAPSASSGGPSAGLRVLLQNAGSFIFDDFTDDREDCLTRSIRIQSALVLLALAKKSHAPTTTGPTTPKKAKFEDETGKHLAVELLLRHEQRISLIAASRQDASPVLARLLSYLP